MNLGIDPPAELQQHAGRCQPPLPTVRHAPTHSTGHAHMCMCTLNRHVHVHTYMRTHYYACACAHTHTRTHSAHLFMCSARMHTHDMHMCMSVPHSRTPRHHPSLTRSVPYRDPPLCCLSNHNIVVTDGIVAVRCPSSSGQSLKQLRAPVLLV